MTAEKPKTTGAQRAAVRFLARLKSHRQLPPSPPSRQVLRRRALKARKAAEAAARKAAIAGRRSRKGA